jgi:CDP-paratose 2-epimerase
MRVLITGACGFVGSSVAAALRELDEGISIVGMDNFIRPGSEMNRLKLIRLGVRIVHGDVRQASDFESLPETDWALDAAANPSVLAGVDGKSSSRQLVEHNLLGTVNLLEYCKQRNAGLILLSSSRVYSVGALSSLPLQVCAERFVIDGSGPLPTGVSSAGISEEFSTQAPISLYGSTKLASEALALEYGATFGFPVWINRCGVLAGAGQMGTAEQGIFSYWVHSHSRKRPLRYIGFDGLGHQLRDAFHPADLTALLHQQMNEPDKPGARLFNLGGGPDNSMSLAELTDWCCQRFGPHSVEPDARPRPFDIPWLVMDSARATAYFGWKPRKRLPQILDEIAVHAEQNPDWLPITAST